MTNETIHGYPIMAQADVRDGAGARPGRIIMVRRQDEFVTGLQCRTGDRWDNEWCWGHYFTDENEARADFAKRAERGY